MKTPLRGGNKLYLRCVISETGGRYIGTCLELSVSVRSNSVEECKDELVSLINDYTETARECQSEGEKVKFTPVRHYWAKRILFDLRLALLSSTSTKQPPNMFTKEVVVPAT